MSPIFLSSFVGRRRLAVGISSLLWVLSGHVAPALAAHPAEAPPAAPARSTPARATNLTTQLVAQTSNSAKDSTKMTIDREDFGQTTAGEKVSAYRLSNGKMFVKLLDYGAIVQSVEVPDRQGKLTNVNLGFDKIAGYEQRHPYFGATVGRYCNRIARGKFTLDGKTYSLATNNDVNHLHGGDKGFDRYVWKAEPSASAEKVSVKFTRRSPDGEEGYPGNLDVTAVYSLTAQNELIMEFMASTDKKTVVNLTNHCYWNLAGAGAGAVLNHELQLEADKYLAVDDTLIPTGEMVDVNGTPLDFRRTKAIGAEIAKIPAKIGGYDHCYVLRSQSGQLALAAKVKDPASGRVMEIRTTQPGIQLYTGNFLDGGAGNGGFSKHGAFCLETQHYPDSPNHPDFPTTVLEPGQKFHQTTVHKFSVE